MTEQTKAAEDAAAEKAAAEKAAAESEAKPKTRAKPKSRSQLAREKAASETKATEDGILKSSPLWQVIYPTGISLHRPDDDEIVVDVNGSDTDVEVLDGHAHVPVNARIRAGSLAELSNFTDLAGQGMLRQVLETH